MFIVELRNVYKYTKQHTVKKSLRGTGLSKSHVFSENCVAQSQSLPLLVTCRNTFIIQLHTMGEILHIKVELGGGTELLFDKQKLIELEFQPDNEEWTISRLIKHLGEKYVKERTELFANGDKIRPGILVLVNEVDYEVLGKDKYVLKDKDSVIFISTLHGG